MTTRQPQLSEKDFINESYDKDPYPFWFWFFIVAGFSLVIWAGSLWYNERLFTLLQKNPFLQVTNREMSLFLWQNPEFMRAAVKEKNGYLPAFEYMDKIGLIPEEADDYVSAPPEVLFRYHTWQRLLGNIYIPLPIPKEQFSLFLDDAREWQPEFWSQAPKAYVDMLIDLPNSSVDDLSTLPENALPKEVRMAFQGWHNFFYEGEAINRFSPSKEMLESFLKKYPHYARNYWQNIVKGYLEDGKEPPFLKVALYNYDRFFFTAEAQRK